MRQNIFQAMQDYDNWVIEFDYCDSKGQRTRRVVSPIRFLGQGKFLALCLSREEPRQFCMERCASVELRPAHEYLMPVALAG